MDRATIAPLLIITVGWPVLLLAFGCVLRWLSGGG